MKHGIENQMEAKKVTVGENSFHIKPFSAFKAANLTGELASVLSPLIGAIAPLVGDGDLMDVDVNKACRGTANINRNQRRQIGGSDEETPARRQYCY